MATLKKLLILTLLTVGATAPIATAQEPVSDHSYATATVESILSTTQDDIAGATRLLQSLRVRLDSGAQAGALVTVENGVVNGTQDELLSVGDRIVLQAMTDETGRTTYAVRETYRLPALLWLTVFFVLIAFLLGGWTSLRSLLGLVVSILLLALVMVPAILRGYDPLLVSLGGGILIAATSIYVAHGFRRQTTIAVLSTILTLCLSVVAALIAVSVAKLFGAGSEEAIFLQLGPLQQLNLRGLLLGGMMIGALGVLDDITTAQAAAVNEVRRANPNITQKELIASGTNVGREHIASLINTLALAYVGSSLPLLLLFTTEGAAPLWMILNTESIAEEIVRTLVGSLTLLLAVPITTHLAARFLHGTEATHGHTHLH